MGNGKSKTPDGPSAQSKGTEESTSPSSSANQQSMQLSRPRDTRLLPVLERLITPPARPISFNSIFHVTEKAFYFEKPLFAESEKVRAFTALRNWIPILVAGYRHLYIHMAVEDNREAQISRSGLQFIADEVTESEDPELYEQLQTLIDSPHMRSIEESIKDTTGIPREWGTDEEVDPSRIPSSHYWWFYVRSEDEE